MARKQAVLTETMQNRALKSQVLVVGTGGTLETSDGKPSTGGTEQLLATRKRKCFSGIVGKRCQAEGN